MYLSLAPLYLILLMATTGLAYTLIRRDGLGSPVIFLSLVYAYLSFGTVLSYHLGNEVYPGIRSEYIPQAVTIFLLGQFGLLLGALPFRMPVVFSMEKHDADVRHGTLLPWILSGLTAVTLFLIVVVVTIPSVGGKNATIDAVGAGLHYPLLTLQKAAMSLYFLVREHPQWRRAYYINAAAYVGYCLLLGERDFIFIVAAIVAYKVVIGELRIGVKVLLLGFTGLILGGLINQIRDPNTSVDPKSLIESQDSILFINTNILHLFPVSYPFQWGRSYLDAIITIIPAPLLGGDYQTLTSWFKTWFAPTGRSGYGFALDAEAYLNFGYIGVPLVFGIASMSLMWLSRRFDKGAIYSYSSVYLLSGLMYGVRTESWMIIHSFVYALMFFYIVQTRKKPALGPQPVPDAILGQAQKH